MTDPWATSQKIGFRFIFLFFMCIIIFLNNEAYPFWDVLMTYPEKWFVIIARWFGKSLLGINYQYSTEPNGSGDTTYNWIKLLILFSTAIFGMVVWSILDKKRSNYQRLFYYLTLAIRFYVGLMLVSYGLYKVFKLQMPAPDIFRLLQPYGDSSPMGLAWTFLGFSKGYNLFMGCSELAAILLLFRRTMTLGAIITLMTTANVMAVNYFYDVPVKILSTILFAMTLFLLMPNIKQLWNFFLSDSYVKLDLIPIPVYKNIWVPRVENYFTYALLFYSIGYNGYTLNNVRIEMGDDAPKHKLYGAYEVESFIINGDTLPPLMTDSTRWYRLITSNESYAGVVMMGGKKERYEMSYDTIKNDLTLSHMNDASKVYRLKYVIGKDKLQLSGMLEDKSADITLRKMDVEKNALLTSTPFKWISEEPFNR